MAYEIVMPQLSDSMDEGKLISWKIKEGDFVKKGDVIAEVESDKAIMEVQSFQTGTVKSIHVKEGESVPVGTVIVTVDTDAKETTHKETPEPKEIPKQQENAKQTLHPHEENVTAEQNKSKPEIKQTQPPKQNTSFLDELLGLEEHPEVEKPAPHVEGEASPKAKALAARYGIDIQTMQTNGKLPIPVHEKDIQQYRLTRYFTQKALKLLELYHLDSTLFTEDKKHDSADIMTYVQTHDIPLPKPLDGFQKALISAVTQSAQKPVYHLYDGIDATLFKEHKEHTVTVWLVKLFAETMMAHENFRATLGKNGIQIWPNASLSLAVPYESYLYMPVFKDANLQSPAQIHQQLQSYEEKAKTTTMTAQDMQGSTFGISNLGMLGIERFDAMINKQDSAIAAIGSLVEGKITVTLTLDHRLINGYQAAQFMQTLKKLAQNPQFFKDA